MTQTIINNGYLRTDLFATVVQHLSINYVNVESWNITITHTFMLHIVTFYVKIIKYCQAQPKPKLS